MNPNNDANTTQSATSLAQPCPPVPFPPWFPWPNGPFIPYPTQPDFLLGLSAGALHGQMFRDGVQRFQNADKCYARMMQQEVTDLARMTGIPRAEERRLQHIVTLVVGLREHPTDQERIQSIQSMHRQLVDEGAKPITLALSGIAADSAQNGPNWAYADVDGALKGGILGTAVAGPGWGTLIGGLIGGGASSLTAYFGSSQT